MVLNDIGQERQSKDCGYFAGFAAHLRDRAGAAVVSTQVSAEQVYVARNRFNGNQVGDMEPTWRGMGLYPGNRMVPYLESLNCNRYRGQGFDRLVLMSDPGRIRSLLRRHVPPPAGNSVLLLAVNHITVGHWVAFLARTGENERPRRTQLKWGLKGVEVELLQATLNLVGLSRLPALVEDGDFGNKTYYRVREFQEQQRIRIDGVVGRQTWKRLEPYVVQYFSESDESQVRYTWYDPLEQPKRLLTAHEADVVQALTHDAISYYVWRHDSMN